MRKKIGILSIVTSAALAMTYCGSFLIMFADALQEFACTCSLDYYAFPLMVTMSFAFLGIMFTIFAIVDQKGKVKNPHFGTVTTLVGAAVSLIGFISFFFFLDSYIYGALGGSSLAYFGIVILPIILSIAGILADIAIVVMEIIMLCGKGDQVELFAAEKTEQAKAKWENAKRERYAKATGDASADGTVAPADRNAFVFSIASVCLSLIIPVVGLGFGIAALNIEKKHPHKMTFRLSVIGCILSVIAFIVWLWILALNMFY